MLLQTNQTKNFEYLTILTVVLYIVSLIYNVHVEPLRLEEPRRGLVALEMLLNNNFIVTTILNETWYDHPPLYNIVLALSLKIFGFNTFALRFPGVFSLVLTGYVIYRFGKTYISKKFGIVSSLFYLVAVDIYFYFSTLAEIDIFYSLLVVLSLYSVFHFYQKKQFYRLFGFAYLFINLAFLTKGFASYAFIVLTLLAYFSYQKSFKKLFSFAHIIAIFATVVFLGSYFYNYFLYADLIEYLSKMWGLSSSRTILERGVGTLIIHFITFPLNFIGVMFPATLLLIFIFNKAAIRNIKQHPFIVFLAITFLVNFLVYLISPGAKIRYTYMFFPMVIAVLTYPFYLQMEEDSKRTKFFYGIIQVLMILMSIVLIAAPFINIAYNPLYFNFSSLAFALLIIVFLVLNLKTKASLKFISMIILFVVCRLAFDHIALPLKAETLKNKENKMHAEAIYKIIGNKKDLYVLSTDDVNSLDKQNKFDDMPFKLYETAAYLEMFRKKIITKTPILKDQGFYIINLDKNKNQKTLYEFVIQEKNLGLIEKH